MKRQATTKLKLCGLINRAKATTTLKELIRYSQEFKHYSPKQLAPQFILPQPKSQYQHLKVLALSLPDPVPTQYPPQETVTQQDGWPTRPSFSNFEQNQEILEEGETETETDIENLADNFVLETVEPAFTGSGGWEPLDINVSIGGTGAETGSGDAETGSGGIEKLIAPLESTEPVELTAPLIAPMVNWNVGDRVKVSTWVSQRSRLCRRASHCS